MFDNAAQTYDETFTHSSIGKSQRRQVYKYLENIIPQGKLLQILELNCGTGEDAVYFAKQGHIVTATDISKAMIKEAEKKATHEGLNEKIQFLVADIRDLSEISSRKTFDMVFSNFGGLNCISSEDLNILSVKLGKLLKTDGRFIAVIMPKFCLWESVYSMAKFKGGHIFRRNSNKQVAVNVGDDLVETWYYSPGDFRRMFGDRFQFIAMKPIGMVLPPSYMESYFSKRQEMLDKLEKVEVLINKIPVLSNWSDHFLIDFRNC